MAVTARLADGRGVRVELRDGLIAAITELDGAPDVLLLPGLVDLQVNGYAGFDVNAENVTADDVVGLVQALWRQGVTTVCPTIITASESRIVASLRAIAAARDQHPLVRHSIAGIHVEGPYLSPEDGPRGAHDAEHLRDPDLAEFERWQQACGGLVRIVTLAPERPGALAYIAELARRGTGTSIGHTAASPAQIAAAAQAGATLSTHLGNGAHDLLPRHPNYLWTQLADDRLTATFIADGHHLPADTFTAMLRAKGLDRAVLVSDSVALAGCPPGEYTTPVGGMITAHPDGRLTLPGSDLLAGSGRSLLDCVSWAISHTELDLGTALRLAATNPARLLGREPGLQVGAAADLVVAAPDLSVLRTLVRGEVVHNA